MSLPMILIIVVAGFVVALSSVCAASVLLEDRAEKKFRKQEERLGLSSTIRIDFIDKR